MSRILAHPTISHKNNSPKVRNTWCSTHKISAINSTVFTLHCFFFLIKVTYLGVPSESVPPMETFDVAKQFSRASFS